MRSRPELLTGPAHKPRLIGFPLYWLSDLRIVDLVLRDHLLEQPERTLPELRRN